MSTRETYRRGAGRAPQAGTTIRCAGDRVRDDDAGETEHLLDQLGRHDLGRGALGDDPAVGHRDDVVAEPAGEVQVVQDDDDRLAGFRVERAQQAQELDLVVDVQVGGRLVERAAITSAV
jgi:hypothetical protein